MANDRFGLRWGLAGGTTLASIAETRTAAQFAQDNNFDSFWVSHAAGVDSITALACVANDVPELGEVGTSVVPIYGRHPVSFAQQVRTAQNALGGRFTLGIGAGSRRSTEGKLGLTWDKPYSYTREFLAGLQPLLAGEAADTDGEQISAHAELGIEAESTPILLAALGPRMLKFAGGHLQGTTLGQCGPKTISSYIRPTLAAGAEAAGRDPAGLRVMALVRFCVTDDIAGAKVLAREIAAGYQANPSYANATQHEGLEDASDLHLIGSWQFVLDNLANYAEAGTTDLRIQVAAHTDTAKEASYAALADYLG